MFLDLCGRECKYFTITHTNKIIAYTRLHSYYEARILVFCYDPKHNVTIKCDYDDDDDLDYSWSGSTKRDFKEIKNIFADKDDNIIVVFQDNEVQIHDRQGNFKFSGIYPITSLLTVNNDGYIVEVNDSRVQIYDLVGNLVEKYSDIFGEIKSIAINSKNQCIALYSDGQVMNLFDFKLAPKELYFDEDTFDRIRIGSDDKIIIDSKYGPFVLLDADGDVILDGDLNSGTQLFSTNKGKIYVQENGDIEIIPYTIYEGKHLTIEDLPRWLCD